jgi:hypothetical protein
MLQEWSDKHPDPPEPLWPRLWRWWGGCLPNDGFVSLLNNDGAVHTPKWIGAPCTGLILNQPFGSDIHEEKLCVGDSDDGTADGAPACR